MVLPQGCEWTFWWQIENTALQCYHAQMGRRCLTPPPPGHASSFWSLVFLRVPLAFPVNHTVTLWCCSFRFLNNLRAALCSPVQAVLDGLHHCQSMTPCRVLRCICKTCFSFFSTFPTAASQKSSVSGCCWRFFGTYFMHNTRYKKISWADIKGGFETQ